VVSEGCVVGTTSNCILSLLSPLAMSARTIQPDFGREITQQWNKFEFCDGGSLHTLLIIRHLCTVKRNILR